MSDEDEDEIVCMDAAGQVLIGKVQDGVVSGLAPCSGRQCCRIAKWSNSDSDACMYIIVVS